MALETNTENKKGSKEFENLLDKAIGVFDMLWEQGLKFIRQDEPESYAHSWNHLRAKVNTIENYP